MDPRGLGPPARHVSPVTVTYSTVTAAGSQQGPVVPHPQNCGGQPHSSFPPVNLIEQQGQTTAQITFQQQWQQQQYLMDGQNQRLSQNQNEVYMPSQQSNFNLHLLNVSRQAVPQPKNYGGNPYLGIPKANIYPQQGLSTAQQASQQQRQQQHYLMNEQNGLSAPNQYKVYTPIQQQSFNQRMAIALRPALVFDRNYGVQDLWVFSRGNRIQPLVQTTAQQTSNQQHQQQLQYQQQIMNEQMALHENKAYMSYQQPHSTQELRTPLEFDRRWDSLDCTTRHLPPLIQLDGSMENTSTSAAIPTGHIPTSPAFPMKKTSFSPLHRMGSIYTPPDISLGNISSTPAVPMGNMSSSPAVPMGNISASPAVPMGIISASPVNPMGNMSPSCSTSILSASPTDSKGNVHRILLNQRTSQTSNPINDSCSQFPIMAEKREYGDSIGEDENIIAKRPKTDVDTDLPCTSVNNRDLSGDDSRRLDSKNNKDPLSDLTNDQRVVLYTLFLCQDLFGHVCISDDDCAVDIDIMKIVKELAKKGLVKEYNSFYKIQRDKDSMIMKSYRENCLLSEIDKDFFIQVASDQSIKTYAGVYCSHEDGPRESEDIGPITTMRLIVEGHGHRLPDSVKDEVPACLINDEKEFDIFVKFWSKARNSDPITLSDQIPDEKVKNFYSAFTVLSEIKNELMEIHLSKKKWSILISILMSERYSVFKSIQCEEKQKNIQQTFEALQDVKEERAEELWLLLNELELRDELLTVDKEKNKVTFVSEEIRHQVMGFFVLNCLQSNKDYENYLNLSSMDSLIEYVRPLGYRRQSTERCMYLPKGTEEVFVRRFGIDAICNATLGFNQFENAIISELKLPPAVLKMAEETKEKFCNFVKGFDEKNKHHQFYRNSLFGSFLIEINTSIKRAFQG